MTSSTSHHIRGQFEQCIGIIRLASVEILLLLDLRVSEGKDPRWFLEQLDTARLGLGGWGAVAKRLNLNDAEMSDFTLQLRLLQQRVPQYESGQDVSENQLIAAVRFVTSLEHLRLQQPLLSYNTDLAPGNESQQLQAHKQVRAIELIIRSLIMQAWPDQVRLNNHLKTLFNADRVRRWLKLGERNDVLSGMMFSEMAQMLVDKKEFSRYYSRLFNDGTNLTLLVEPRKTLQIFLDDIRQIRNALTVQQTLTSAQLLMLDNYYGQISRPIQRAFEEGRTRINPTGLMAVDASELHSFWENAQKMDRQTGGDLFEVRDSIEKPTQRAPRTPEQRDQLISGTLWGAVGVMVLAIIAGGVWLVVSEMPSAPAATVTAQVQAPLPETRDKPSPREKLTRMGVTWDENSLRSAIDRNDTRMTLLFLQSGMDWKLSWTEQAMASKNDEVLEVLMRYPQKMVEEKPCRRFISTLSHAMSNGEPLTSVRKQFLAAFCTVPAVVKRQKREVEQATLRAQAQPDEINKRWQSIQADIYDVIR
ncbi:STY4199 family HEPN domain-containing protein [Enterobacter sp. 638]|uniref:Inner membrane protein n=1 Tax=Enterobacter sp. (strain 638) TaxID=399742 RepID=A0A9J9GJE0_ENT38|nr:STY4199 family HEPN domain-containing protein [Enterobacter sp. 638]ABP62570.1 putative inner membrane protein [Enterobacter sp. 638]